MASASLPASGSTSRPKRRPWKLTGVGCGQPETFLYAFSTPAAADESTRGTFENYPWTPLARFPLPPAALEALRANLPVQAPLDGECQVAPQSAPIALCYTNRVETESGFEVNFLYFGTSGGWKATLTRLPDGSYRVDSVVEQGI